MSWRDMIRQSIGVYDPDESVLRAIVFSPCEAQMFSYSMHWALCLKPRVMAIVCWMLIVVRVRASSLIAIVW